MFEPGLEVLHVLTSQTCSDDVIVTKLWCLSKRMQELICGNLKHVTCYARPTLAISLQQAHPPFLSRLTALRILHFRTFPLSTQSSIRDKKLYGRISWKDIPASAEEIVIADSTILMRKQDRSLLELVTSRPHLKVRIEVDHDDELEESDFSEHINFPNKASVSLITGLLSHINERTTVIPLTLTTLTILSHRTIKEFYARWDTFNTYVKNWLIEYWCPLVDTVRFGHHNEDLQDWCYTIFPNIKHVNGVINKLPSETLSYNANSLNHRYFTISTQAPLLVSLQVNIKLDNIVLNTVFLPATLRQLKIDILAYRKQDSASLMSFLEMIPQELEELSLKVYQVSQNFFEEVVHQSTWCTSEILQLLPPNLLSLTTNPGIIPTDSKLPKTLTQLNFPYNAVVDLPELVRHLPNITALGQITARDNYQCTGQLYLLHILPALVSISLVIKNYNVLTLYQSPFPDTVKFIKLDFDSTNINTVSDPLVDTIFPPCLEELTITSRSSLRILVSINLAQWKPLPDSLHSLHIEHVKIASLPQSWPTSLRYLSLGLISSFNSRLNVNDVPTGERALAHELIMAIPGIQWLANLPRWCVIKIGKLIKVQRNPFAIHLIY